MISDKEVDLLLARRHATEHSGTLIHHEIAKQQGLASRHRHYAVYLPRGYTDACDYPLVVVLHGCRQDHMAIRSISGFDGIADRVGAVMVYPFVTNYSDLRAQNCWGWWLNTHRQRGKGEVSDLQSIALQVSQHYSIDPHRRYICGLSAGAAMSVASLVSYSDFWASGASVAGVPYGESSRSVNYNPHVPVSTKSVNTLTRLLKRELVAPVPPLLIVQSHNDQIVSPVLGENLRDSWIGVSDCNAVPEAVFGNSTHGIGWKFEQYCSSQRLHLGHFLLHDLDHGWPGGRPGDFCFPDAPNISELIWAFFDGHRP